ncbi:unnamed protein product [Amoebophrya sp. A25]|nr:unnamed protein product [Amoebophrya sp. A25]|eukprot:GSA25T00011052001.1
MPKSIFTSASLNYTATPSLLSCAFCGPTQLVYVAAKHLCFLDIVTETREFVPLPEGVYAAKCLAASGKYVALATSGIFPCIYVFADKKLFFVIPKVAELDVPDLQFSACSTRLYALGKSTSSTRFLVFNTADGSILPGCENVSSLPRYQLDRLFVSPLDKDRVFLCNSTRRVAQLSRIARRFKKYIVTLYDNSIPELGDGEVMSPLEGYTWTPKGRFLVSTKNAILLLCRETGVILYTWRSFSTIEDDRLANGYISNMMFISTFLVAVHEVKKPHSTAGDRLQYIVYWLYDQDEEDSAESGQGGLADLFRMQDICDLNHSAEYKGVTSLTPSPDFARALMTTAGGNLFRWSLPTGEELEEIARKLEEDILGEPQDVTLDLKPLARCHVNFITSCGFMESGGEAAMVTGDETGLVQVVSCKSKEVRTVRLQWGVQCLLPISSVGSATGPNDCLLVGSESGALRLLQSSGSDGLMKSVDCVRLSTVGYSALGCDRSLIAAAVYNSSSSEASVPAPATGSSSSVFLMNYVPKKGLAVHGCVDLEAKTIDGLVCYPTQQNETACAAVGAHSKGGDRWRLWVFECPNQNLGPAVANAREAAQQAKQSAGGVETVGGSSSSTARAAAAGAAAGGVLAGVLDFLPVVHVALDQEPCCVSASASEDLVYIGYAGGQIRSVPRAELQQAHVKVEALKQQRELERQALREAGGDLLEGSLNLPPAVSDGEAVGDDALREPAGSQIVSSKQQSKQVSDIEGENAPDDEEVAKSPDDSDHDLLIVTTYAGVTGAMGGAFATPAATSNTGARRPPVPEGTAVAESVVYEHEQPISALSYVAATSTLVAAAMDGVVLVIRKGAAVRQYHMADPFGGGVWSFAVRPPSGPDAPLQALVTSSSEVVSFCEEASEVESWSGLRLGRNVSLLEGGASKGESEVEMAVWTAQGEAAEKEQAGAAESEEVSVANDKARRELQNGLDALRRRLREFLDKNEVAPDLERLQRGEFCIDTEERDLLVKKADDKSGEIRKIVARENLARKLICQRLIKEFWDPMASPGAIVASLLGPQSVANYPERKVDKAETSRIRMIAQMRDVELLEKEWASSSDGPAGDWYLDANKFVPPGIDRQYLINYYGGENIYESSAAAGGEGKKLTEAEQKEIDDAKSIRDRVYTPFELGTNMRRKSQIVLLQTLAKDMQRAFNKKFKKCQEHKKEVMSHISEKIARIRGILKELGRSETVDEPELLPAEVPESVLKVQEKEVAVVKYVSPEERAKKEAEAKAAADKSAKKTNDAGTRALQQMMGGRLKTNKDLTPLERVVEREPWMDNVPPEQWTELQVQLYEEYEQRCALLKEEQNVYSSQLGEELEKLKKEVQELKEAFEGKLSALAGERHRSDLHYYWQEIYTIRLFLALLQAVEDQGIKEFIIQEIHQAQQRLQEAEGVLQQFAEKVRTQERIMEDHVRRDKELSSKFREHFPTLEQEQQNFLLKLFRQRPPKPPGGAASTANVFAKPHKVEKLNPFKPGDEMIVEDYNGTNLDTLHVPVLGDVPEETLKFPEDCSMDGIGKANFELMLDLKHQKQLLEIEIQKLNGVHVEMLKLLDYYQGEVDSARAVFEKEVDDLRAHQSMIDNEDEDYEVMIQLKQGQVEVPPAAVVTDYSDAITFHKEVVEGRNRRIIDLGAEKVAILESVREFRKKINLVIYDQAMLALQKTDLNERTKDVQFLKVTKDVQELLKGGDEKKRQKAIELLERKLDHIGKTTVSTVAALKMKHSKTSMELKKLQQLNLSLSDELEDLVSSVSEREKIKKLSAGSGPEPAPLHQIGKRKKIIGGGGAIAEVNYKAGNPRFAEARRRKVMQDRISNNDEELKGLRTELDRLRQKTFPSFVQVHEERQGIAD